MRKDLDYSDNILRRTLLRQSACGFGMLGLAGLLADQGLVAAAAPENPLAPKAPHFPARAKRVIFLFMHGGPSHVDTFDPKPRLEQDNGKPIPFKRSLTFAEGKLGGLMKSPWGFKQYGQSGIPASDLFTRVGTHVDELCMIHSVVGDGVDHGGAVLQLQTGTINFSRPSMGAWILYGLGTDNQNLPGFITIMPSLYHGGSKHWGSSFLPGVYQGIPIGNDKMVAKDLKDEPIEHLRARDVTTDQQRYELEMLKNSISSTPRCGNPILSSRPGSRHLSWRLECKWKRLTYSASKRSLRKPGNYTASMTR